MKKKSKGTPSGFRDLSSTEAQLKEYVVQSIAKVYKKYGFLPIETPIVEFSETLAGEVTDFNLFIVNPSKAREQGEAEALALRFDQTVPLARYIADNQHITKPFKRYVYGPVFRGERPQSGRYRQFDQFDADTVGTNNIAADIEIILMMREVLQEIGIQRFVVKVNTRKLLNSLPFIFNFPEEKLRSVLVSLDKRDKLSETELRSLLEEQKLSETSIDGLIQFGKLTGAPTVIMQTLRSLCGTIPQAKEGLDDLERITATLEAVGDENILLDMSIIRGLGYYTGTIFETSLLDVPEFGSVYSGGRYDNLVENFGVQQQPAVGASVGVDRLVAALTKISFSIPTQKKKIIVLVQDVSVTAYAFEVATKIRKTGSVCEVYTGSKRKISDQFSYADQKNYSFACVVGPDEQNNRTVAIKNLETKEQKVEKIDFLKF